jgi:hypothetical protein
MASCARQILGSRLGRRGSSHWPCGARPPARPNSSERIYVPRRDPDYNESNYRTVVSRPAWAGLDPNRRAREGGQP